MVPSGPRIEWSPDLLFSVRVVNLPDLKDFPGFRLRSGPSCYPGVYSDQVSVRDQRPRPRHPVPVRRLPFIIVREWVNVCIEECKGCGTNP